MRKSIKIIELKTVLRKKFDYCGHRAWKHFTGSWVYSAQFLWMVIASSNCCKMALSTLSVVSNMKKSLVAELWNSTALLNCGTVFLDRKICRKRHQQRDWICLFSAQPTSQSPQLSFLSGSARASISTIAGKSCRMCQAIFFVLWPGNGQVGGYECC